MSRPLSVGLTGGLASGKSTVLKVMEQQGAHVSRADDVAREAMRPGTALHKTIADEFGPECLNEAGELDRHYLADRVFSTPHLKTKLEQLIHPVVFDRHQANLTELARTSATQVAVFEAAVLIETGRVHEFDVLVVVTCSPEQQLERAVARGMSVEDAKARLETQGPVSDKLKHADIVIDTSGTLAETQLRAETVYERLVVLSESLA
jgi:dephospho-CoA kinase